MRHFETMMQTKVFSGRFESLPAIGDFVIEAAQAAGLDESAVYAVQLAVDEAATNVIEHAYRGMEPGNLECGCEILPDGLKIVLKDYGRPFSPDEVPEPETNAPLEDVKPRGLGLFFMRRMMDDMRFEFSEKNGNRLIMIKRKH